MRPKGYIGLMKKSIICKEWTVSLKAIFLQEYTIDGKLSIMGPAYFLPYGVSLEKCVLKVGKAIGGLPKLSPANCVHGFSISKISKSHRYLRVYSCTLFVKSIMYTSAD
jgi:hypothetical protein